MMEMQVAWTSREAVRDPDTGFESHAACQGPSFGLVVTISNENRNLWRILLNSLRQALTQSVSGWPDPRPCYDFMYDTFECKVARRTWG